MENIHENQVGEVLPYQYEPEVGEKGTNISDESDSDRERDLSSSSKEIDQEFETANAWRLQTVSWCKCGHCTISQKLFECFCCHKKALEYDEYDNLLGHCETQGQKCVTLHPGFQDNMLSECVLKIDVCRYLEENWPLDDEDLEGYTNSTDLWHTSDVLAGFSRFWGRKTGGLFLLVFMQKYVNASLLQMAFIHILNMQKHQKGIVYVCLSFFLLTIQYRLVWLCIKFASVLMTHMAQNFMQLI